MRGNYQAGMQTCCFHHCGLFANYSLPETQLSTRKSQLEQEKQRRRRRRSTRRRICSRVYVGFSPIHFPSSCRLYDLLLPRKFVMKQFFLCLSHICSIWNLRPSVKLYFNVCGYANAKRRRVPRFVLCRLSFIPLMTLKYSHVFSAQSK